MNNKNNTRKVISTWIKMELVGVMAVVFCIPSYSQVSLDSCLQSAYNNHPALKAREVIGDIYEYKLENNRRADYPRFSLSGQGKYQSDVVELDIESPFGDLEFPEVPHLQFSAALNASQVIYNGGKRGIEKQMIINEYEASISELEATRRSIRESVQEIYLGILLKEKQVDVIELLGHTIDLSIKRLEAGIEGGVVPEIDLDLLMAEKINLNKKYLSLEETRKSMVQSLSIICCIDIDPSVRLIVPTVDFIPLTPDRPETDVFRSRINGMDLKKEMLGLKRLPQISAFGQAGYGRPGLNMLSDEWQDFYIVGLQLAWIPWDYNETRREKNILELNTRLIKYEEESFNKELDLASKNMINQIKLIENLIVEDEMMLGLRIEISAAMQKKLNEGVITGSEYLAELNREREARLELEKSRIELIASKLAYQVINGK